MKIMSDASTPVILAFAAFLPFLALATFYDLRERRIPNAVNSAAFAAGVALTVFFKPTAFLTNYFAFVALAFAFAYVLYKIGAWAGGDVKFFLALSALYPTAKGTVLATAFDFLALPVVFVFAAFAVVPVLVPLALKKRVKTAFLEADAKKALAAAARAAPFSAAVVGALNIALGVSPMLFLAAAAAAFLVKAPFVLGVVFFIVMFFFEATATLVALPFSFAAIAFAAFCVKSFPTLSQKVLRAKKKISEVREGDIPAYTIFLDKRGKTRVWRPRFRKILENALRGKKFTPEGSVIASSFAARGLSKEEIRKLKVFGVRALEVKETMPFAPALGIGWLLAIVLW